MEFLFLTTILILFAGGLSDENKNISRQYEEDYRYVIQKLIFSLPKFQTIINKKIIRVSNINLYGIDIKSINISKKQDKSTNIESILLNLEINEAYLNATIKSIIKTQIQIVNFTISLPIVFFRAKNQLLENLAINKNSFFSSLENISIIFEGSFSSLVKKYIPLIRDSVFDLVNNNTNFYSFLNPIIGKKGRELFEMINGCVHSKINLIKQLQIPINDHEELIPIIISPVVDISRYILNELVRDISNPLYLNNFINRYIDDEGSINMSKIGEKVGFDIPIILKVQKNLELVIKDVFITGLNTWHDMSFLFPVSNSKYILDSHSAVDDVEINLITELRFNSNISHEINFSANLVNNKVDFGIQIAALKNGGLNYTSSQFFNINCLSKLLNLNESGITKFLLDTTFKNVNYESNGFLDGFFDESFNFIKSYIFLNNSILFSQFFNGFIYEYVFMNGVNNFIYDLINSQTCQIVDDPTINEMDIKVTYISFSIAAGLGILFGTFVIIRSNKKTQNDNSNELSKWQLFCRTDDKASLMLHPAIPLWTRMIVPLLIFLIFALNYSSNTGHGASIFIKLVINDTQVISLPELIHFNLIDSAVDLWKNGSYFLSFIIFVFSGIWPLVKLVLLFITWILPATIVKAHIRKRILNVLNELGKWSLLESYVIFVMAVAYHLKFDFPIYNTNDIHIPSYLYIWIHLGYGFITLILSTLLSLAMSNVICVINKKVDKYNVELNDETKRIVFNKKNKVFNSLFVIVIFFILVAYSCGIGFKLCSFDLIGYTGWLIDVFRKDTSKSFNAIQIGIEVSKSAEHPKSFKVLFAQIFFYLLTIIIPYVHLIFLILLVFLPLTKKNLARLFYICRLLYSWSCNDVFIVSFFVSFFVIKKVYISGRKCKFLKPIVDEKLIENNSKCYEISTRIQSSAYLILLSAVLCTFLKIFVDINVRRIIKDEASNDHDSSIDEDDSKHDSLSS